MEPFDIVTTSDDRIAVVTRTTQDGPVELAFEGGERGPVPPGPLRVTVVDDPASVMRECLPSHFVVQIDGAYRMLDEWPPEERAAVWKAHGLK